MYSFLIENVGIWFKPMKSDASACILNCHTQLSSMTNIKEHSREICICFQHLRNLVQIFIFWITNTQQLRSNLNRLVFGICFAIYLHQLLPGLQSIPPSIHFLKSSKTFNISSRLTVSALTFVSLSSNMEQVARVKRQTIQWPKEVQS